MLFTSADCRSLSSSQKDEERTQQTFSDSSISPQRQPPAWFSSTSTSTSTLESTLKTRRHDDELFYSSTESPCDRSDVEKCRDVSVGNKSETSKNNSQERKYSGKKKRKSEKENPVESLLEDLLHATQVKSSHDPPVKNASNISSSSQCCNATNSASRNNVVSFEDYSSLSNSTTSDSSVTANSIIDPNLSSSTSPSETRDGKGSVRLPTSWKDLEDQYLTSAIHLLQKLVEDEKKEVKEADKEEGEEMSKSHDKKDDEGEPLKKEVRSVTSSMATMTASTSFSPTINSFTTTSSNSPDERNVTTVSPVVVPVVKDGENVSSSSVVNSLSPPLSSSNELKTIFNGSKDEDEKLNYHASRFSPSDSSAIQRTGTSHLTTTTFSLSTTSSLASVMSTEGTSSDDALYPLITTSISSSPLTQPTERMTTLSSVKTKGQEESDVKVFSGGEGEKHRQASLHQETKMTSTSLPLMVVSMSSTPLSPLILSSTTRGDITENKSSQDVVEVSSSSSVVVDTRVIHPSPPTGASQLSLSGERMTTLGQREEKSNFIYFSDGTERMNENDDDDYRRDGTLFSSKATSPESDDNSSLQQTTPRLVIHDELFQPTHSSVSFDGGNRPSFNFHRGCLFVSSVISLSLIALTIFSQVRGWRRKRISLKGKRSRIRRSANWPLSASTRKNMPLSHQEGGIQSSSSFDNNNMTRDEIGKEEGNVEEDIEKDNSISFSFSSRHQNNGSICCPRRSFILVNMLSVLAGIELLFLIGVPFKVFDQVSSSDNPASYSTLFVFLMSIFLSSPSVAKNEVSIGQKEDDTRGILLSWKTGEQVCNFFTLMMHFLHLSAAFWMLSFSIYLFQTRKPSVQGKGINIKMAPASNVISSSSSTSKLSKRRKLRHLFRRVISTSRSTIHPFLSSSGGDKLQGSSITGGDERRTKMTDRELYDDDKCPSLTSSHHHQQKPENSFRRHHHHHYRHPPQQEEHLNSHHHHYHSRRFASLLPKRNLLSVWVRKLLLRAVYPLMPSFVLAASSSSKHFSPSSSSSSSTSRCHLPSFVFTRRQREKRKMSSVKTTNMTISPEDADEERTLGIPKDAMTEVHQQQEDEDRKEGDKRTSSSTTTWSRLHFSLLSWGVPLLIVLLSYLSNPTGYDIKRYCWMSVEGGMVFSFIVPVSLLIMVNTVVMLMVQKQMFSSRSILSEMMISKASALSRLEDGEGTDGLIQGESTSSNSEEGDEEEDEKHQPSTQHHPQTLPHYGSFVDDDVEYDGDFRRRNLHHQLSSLRAGVTLLPFFGVNWFFSVLSLEDTSSYSFQVMFSTSNIILSLLIFIFFFVHRQSSQRFARNKGRLKMMMLPRATPADDGSVAAGSSFDHFVKTGKCFLLNSQQFFYHNHHNYFPYDLYDDADYDYDLADDADDEDDDLVEDEAFFGDFEDDDGIAGVEDIARNEDAILEFAFLRRNCNNASEDVDDESNSFERGHHVGSSIDDDDDENFSLSSQYLKHPGFKSNRRQQHPYFDLTSSRHNEDENNLPSHETQVSSSSPFPLNHSLKPKGGDIHLIHQNKTHRYFDDEDGMEEIDILSSSSSSTSSSSREGSDYDDDKVALEPQDTKTSLLTTSTKISS